MVNRIMQLLVHFDQLHVAAGMTHFKKSKSKPNNFCQHPKHLKKKANER